MRLFCCVFALLFYFFYVYLCVFLFVYFFFFFFKQKTAYEMRISDWSSDVCSSDLRISKGRTWLFSLHRAHQRVDAAVEEGERRLILDGVFAELGLFDRKLDRVSVKRRLDRYAIERVAAEPWRSFRDMGHACRLQSRATAFGPLQLRREIDVARFEAGRGGVGDVRREHLQPFRTQCESIALHRSEEHT